jgi:hypothetical protein
VVKPKEYRIESLKSFDQPGDWKAEYFVGSLGRFSCIVCLWAREGLNDTTPLCAHCSS